MHFPHLWHCLLEHLGNENNYSKYVQLSYTNWKVHQHNSTITTSKSTWSDALHLREDSFNNIINNLYYNTRRINNIMALPKLNESIKYEIVIPSTKRTVTYRPYLVKEEKILLQAFEAKDEKTAMRAMVDTVIACVYDTLNPKSLTTFDVEYLFSQIRAKSVGETLSSLMEL